MSQLRARGLEPDPPERQSMFPGPEQYAWPTTRRGAERGAGPAGCAILDVLAPPYGGDGSERDCSYYEASVAGAEATLRRLPEGADFTCLGAAYKGLRP